MGFLASDVASQGEIEGAIALLERALDRNPGSVEVMMTLGVYRLRHGEIDAAISVLESATAIDPYSALAHLQLGRAYYYGGELEPAADHMERAVLLNPDYKRTAAQLSLVYRALGREEDARETFLSLLSPDARPFARTAARILGPDRFLRALVALQALRTGDECGDSTEFMSHVLAVIGDREAMFRCLRREVLARHGWYLAVHPVFDSYRNDPRFDELLDAAGLERVEISARRRATSG
jgi:tetratricopeptide (TPR) repeat protein